MAASCTYIDDATETPTRNAEPNQNRTSIGYQRANQATPPAGDLLSRLEYQDTRIKELETALKQATLKSHQHNDAQRLPPTPESIAGVESHVATLNAMDRETMLLRGKSFKTQFHGMSYPGSLLAFIPELTSFTKETFEKYSVLAKVRQDLKALEKMAGQQQPGHQPTADADLTALLPPRAETDESIQLYFDNYESIYHIIHLPSFRNEYYNLWSDLSNARPHFIALVLLLTATTQCLRGAEPRLYSGSDSIARKNALSTIEACEAWLSHQSQKQVTLIDFQIRFLLNLAKLANASKLKRTWTDAGGFVRFCMAAGLHRNPELLRKPTSAMDKEMRRRIWMAAAEFELQASFNRGMISAPWLQQSDYVSPTNIYDEEMDQDTPQLPSPRPLREFTSTSYLVLASETFALRYSLNTVLNNVRQTISFDEAKRYTEEIGSHIQAIPSWTSSTSRAPQAWLAITLRQYLLVLHDRQIRQSTSHAEISFSKMIIVDTAKKLMTAHKALTDDGCRVLSFLCHHQTRAPLSLFHVITTPDPHADTLLTELIERTATQVANDAIEIATDKAERLGCEQRQLWIILAANAFIKTRRDPEKKYAFMQEAVDAIMKPYYKIMACQRDGRSAVGSPTETETEMPNGMVDYLPTGEVQAKAGENVANDPTLLDFDAIADWTFDDWNFDPADFADLGNSFQT